MDQDLLFQSYAFDERHKADLDRDGYAVLPGILTPRACERLTASLDHIRELEATPDLVPSPHFYSAEYDVYLASLIGHPQMVDLARRALGPEIRFDHCVNLSRPPGNHGAGWHSHPYAEDRPELGHLRIFFYVNGFTADDGGLRVAPGTHLYREGALSYATDEEFHAGWLDRRPHPATGQPIPLLTLDAPAGTVALMWTHAAHAVTPRKADSTMRWAIVYAYRNPGASSSSRFITEAFERRAPAGTETLMRPD
jgi:hypothetical protein